MGCILKGGGGLYGRLSLGAVVLAAGQGSRMGYRPKCLLEIAGVPLIRRQLIALSGAGVDQLVVVLGHYADLIRPLIEDFPITVIDLSAEPDLSQKHSVSAGVDALHGKFDAVMVTPSDMPLLGTADYTDLIGAYKKRPEGIQMVRPVVDQGLGNPVIFDYAITDEDQDGVEPMCRNWWNNHQERCFAWPTENDRFVVDIDTLEDLEIVEKRLGRRLTYPGALEMVYGSA